MSEFDKWSSYTYVEVRTGLNQLLTVSCSHKEGEADKVKQFVAENIRSIFHPTTNQVVSNHGGFCSYSRFKLSQHKYAGGGGGYIEVLKIDEPPDGRHGVMIHEYINGSSYFVEFDTLEQACAVFDTQWGMGYEKNFEDKPGYRRRVHCGLLTPWFYAVGDQTITGDYAFPEHTDDHPVFRHGKQFVVKDHDGSYDVKTCMMVVKSKLMRDTWGQPYSGPENRYEVTWEDGSSSSVPSHDIRPLEDSELWIHEAIQKFRKLLGGGAKSFELLFATGGKLQVKFVDPKPTDIMKPGKYWVEAKFEGEAKPRGGWVNFDGKDFPNLRLFVENEAAKRGKVIERIVKIGRSHERGWQHVYERTEE